MVGLIKGDKFIDERGVLRFFNDFDLSEIVRLYEIAPADTKTVRAWQGHQLEKKWFHCLSGSFIINLIKIDSFVAPSANLVPQKIILNFEESNVLSIPKGYATGIKAAKENSRLMVFSNFNVADSKKDDYRFPVNKWKANWQQ